MTRHRLLALLTLLALVAAGCHVSNRLYNPATKTSQQPGGRSIVAVDLGGKNHVDPNCAPMLLARPCVAFVEFDEQGELWDKGQVDAAITLIRDAKKVDPKTIVVGFVHGWKNNANDDAERPNGNVIGFQSVLMALKKQEGGKYRDFPIVGIYFGWRGDLIPKYWPARRQLSYFNREGTAIRIPGASMTSTLTRIMLETHAGESGAHLILVGHSFGGLILERALTQAMTDHVLRFTDGDGNAPAREPPAPQNAKVPGARAGQGDGARADLVVFLNSAASASEGNQMLGLLKDRNALYRVGAPARGAADASGRTAARPLFLSISSLGDTATRFGLPVGHGLSFLNFKLQGSWRNYAMPDGTGVTAQSAYYLSTTAHMQALQSHVIVEGSEDAAARCRLDAAGQPIYFGREFPVTTGQRYQICEKRGRWNDTPYWAMQMPATVVPDHSSIFNVNLLTLLGTFFLDSKEMADTNLRPSLERRR